MGPEAALEMEAPLEVSAPLRPLRPARCSWMLLLLAVLLAAPLVPALNWQDNIRPKMKVELGAEDVFRFGGNESHVDYFRLAVRDGNSLLVGGRNLVYNLSLTDLSENQRLVWFSRPDDIEMCIVKGKDEESCQNYIRILTRTAPGRLLLCGTNSFKPLCREYTVKTGTYTMEREKAGLALCPYDPQQNSTAVYVDGELFTGTVSDFSGLDPIIYREPLQTEQYDSMSLNAPNFVNSMAHGDFVYFFFRETAVEYTNCGKAVFSRVARVCKRDSGGPHNFRNRWTSFLKARLNCSVPGDFPFYFNEMQSTTEMIEGMYGGNHSQLMYGVFTTPVNSISGSAVCAFSLKDINRAFESSFKEQAEMNANWLPVPPNKVPDPRPGQCVNDSRTLPDLTLNFIKTHSLMDGSVGSFFRQPVVIRTSFNYRFTQIAVDPQVKTPGGKAYDVLFIGTDNGKVIKAVNADAADTVSRVSPVVIEEMQVFASHIRVRNVRVVKAGEGGVSDGRLVVVSDAEVQALRLHRCFSDKILSCSECVALQDPYCAWDKQAGRCQAQSTTGAGAKRWADEKQFYQSIATGVHPGCPASKAAATRHSERHGERGDATSASSIHNSHKTFHNADSRQAGKEGDGDGEVINITQGTDSGPEVSAADSLMPQYSVETLAIAVVAGAAAALLLGFAMGYLCGRKCRKDDDDNLPYPDTEYEYFEQRQNVNSRLTAEPKLLPQEEVTYAEPLHLPQVNSKSLNSPKSTLRKVQQHANSTAAHAQETLFQFPEAYAPPSYAQQRMPRDNFGTLRSHHDGFGTTRSVKKVYL